MKTLKITMTKLFCKIKKANKRKPLTMPAQSSTCYCWYNQNTPK